MNKNEKKGSLLILFLSVIGAGFIGLWLYAILQARKTDGIYPMNFNKYGEMNMETAMFIVFFSIFVGIAGREVYRTGKDMYKIT